ncbi:MAG: cobalt-precorrin-5B (C(1))-methyltransferase [Candidatus Promineifilaceae bacterium]
MGHYKHLVPARNRKGNRTGYTTGSNSAAAAKAATVALLTGAFPESVTITLPIGESAEMRPQETEMGADFAYCGMVKDAGDDPDVTHGTLICATVRRSDQTGIVLKGGVGVGRVTLPGIGLPVGDPAINPVPRQQIRDNVRDAWQAIYQDNSEPMLEVTISVPEGELLAKKTLNARLGILDGISILGTTGKVFAYSTAAWRASVIQAVEVAVHNHPDVAVLTTGGRSERYGMILRPEIPEVAFVQLSVFTGSGFETAARMGAKRAIFVGMTGKMIKTAQGHMQTHVAGNQVNFEFLAGVCEAVGSSADLIAQVRAANTGRHFLELCQAQGDMRPVQRVTELALEQLVQFVAKKGRTDMQIEALLVGFNSAELLAYAATPDIETNSTHKPDAPLIERLAADPANSYAGDEDGRSITNE